MTQSTINRLDMVIRILSLYSSHDGLKSGAMEKDSVLRKDMKLSRRTLYGLVSALDIDQTGSNNGALFSTTLLGRRKLEALTASMGRLQRSYGSSDND